MNTKGRWLARLAACRNLKFDRLLVQVALAAIATQSAWGGTDLLSAWQAARQHDPIFEAARAQWQAGQTKQRQGRALLLPQVAVTGSGGYVSTDRDTTGAQFAVPGFGASNDAAFRTRIHGGQATSWALTAQQPLYNAERMANARQLDRQAQMAEVQFRAAQQELILRTAQAYFAVLLAEETLATLQTQKHAAARARDIGQERFDTGASPVTDRDEARARFDEITTQELASRDDLRMKRAAFTDLTDRPAEQLSHLGDAPLDRFSVGPLADWTDRAAQRNPLIAMQELGRDIARDEVEKFRALTSSSLDLFARVADDRMHGGNGFGTTNITSNTRTVGVQLTIPIFTGGMRNAKRDEAAALALKAQFDAQALRQEVLRQTQSAWLGVNTGITRVHAHELALRSAQSRLNATETGKEVGARTMLDLMNAQTDFFQAQRNLAQAKYQLLLSRLSLAATAGELSESELREVNSGLSSANAGASR
jgi:outer membrane protein